MKLILALFLVASVTPLVLAACPNHCTGHGVCGANDKCSCYANWNDEPDCSARKCPYGTAWADTSEGTNDAHNYAVCSNKGKCDAKSGECSCFDGYEGKACQRSICPNECSSHGTCHSMSKLAADSNCAWDSAEQALSTNCVSSGISGYSAGAVSYTSWDADKIQGCRCDAGWSGPDCSSRLCPLGDDILTTCSTGSTVDQTNHVSWLEVIAPAWTINNTHSNAAECTPISDRTKSQNQPSFILTFVDQYNKEWTTRPIPVKRLGEYQNSQTELSDAQQDSSAEIKAALEELPNGAVPTVTVEGYKGSCQSPLDLNCASYNGRSVNFVKASGACSAAFHKGIQHQWYRITFDDGANAGLHQNKLSCQWKGCSLTGNHASSVDTRQAHDNTGGCSPYYRGLGEHYGSDKLQPFEEYFTSFTPDVNLCTVYDTASSVWDTGATGLPSDSDVVAGDKERAACANRGLCNTEDGTCECFEGFYGEACEKQLALS